MIRWEYCDIVLRSGSDREANTLNEYGAQGWEAYQVLPEEGETNRYFFKRPLPADENEYPFEKP